MNNTNFTQSTNIFVNPNYQFKRKAGCKEFPPRRILLLTKFFVRRKDK